MSTAARRRARPVRRLLYRPVSITSPTHDRAERGTRGDRGSEVVGTPGALCDGGARTGSARSATTTRTSTSWRPSSSGPGSGRWRAGSRRSRSRATSSSTRSSTSRSSSCAPRTRASAPSRTPAGTAASRLVEGRGTCESGFTCPFHGWCYGPDGKNTFVSQREVVLRAQPASRATSTSRRCGARCGAAAPGSTSTTTRRRCGECIEPFATIMDAWKVESMRAEWWYACRLPVNWKLAEEAFMEQYHVIETHPQLRDPRAVPAARRRAFDPRTFVDAELHYLRTMSDGMAGMVHANDVAHRRGPARHRAAGRRRRSPMATWQRTLNDAVVSWHRDRGSATSPTSTSSRRTGSTSRWATASRTTSCCRCTAARPPTASARSGPEETLMEIWSLTRFPEGDEPEPPTPPEPWEHDDPRVAADPGAGLLEPAAPAAGPARQGLRVHAPVRADRGAHLELPADDRRLPRRPAPRAAARRRCRRST